MVVLIGESGAGKSTVQRLMCKTGKYVPVVSYTTRQKRNNEEEGVDYHFVTNKEYDALDRNKKIIAKAEYNGWRYGMPVEECEMANTVCVATPAGFRELKKRFDVTAVYINVDRRSRLIKILNRGDNIEEAYRRSLSDVGMFDHIEDEVDFVVDNHKYRKSPDEICREILRNLDGDET